MTTTALSHEETTRAKSLFAGMSKRDLVRVSKKFMADVTCPMTTETRKNRCRELLMLATDERLGRVDWAKVRPLGV